MNMIWGSMLLLGIVFGVLTGEVSAVSEAVFSSAKEATALCVTMFGVMAVWSGLMEIAKDSGLTQAIARWLAPAMRFLFPEIPENHPALEHITVNCVANILGLGNASTVYGLKAMEALGQLEEERRAKEKNTEKDKGRGRDIIRAMPGGCASNEMCNFLILNISSLQLIPVTVIAYRSQYGSVNPAAVVGPGIAATAISTAAAILFCRSMDAVRRRRFPVICRKPKMQ